MHYRSARIVTLEIGPSITARGTLALATRDESFAFAASEFGWNHRATEFTEFESSAVDHALVDYETDSFDDLFLIPEASSLQPPVSGLLPIESVPLGARIATKNPRDWEVQPSLAVAGEAWYEIHATIVRTDGNRVEVELLRPESWVQEEAVEVGQTLRLHLAELNVDGLAVITKLERRDDIDQSDVELGNLVTGRFKTLGAMNVVKAIFSDGTEIVGTDIHPVWSVDRQDWIALGELQEYERVQTRSGTIHLLSLQAALPADVFNIEVDCHHVYEVGDAGVLVHNACDTNKIGRIGELLATDALARRGWNVLGGLTRGNNGLDIIAQKSIGGRLRTIIVEVKANGAKLSELQRMGPRLYAEDVLRRFESGSFKNQRLVQGLVDSGEEIRGVVIRMDWRSGELIEVISRWWNKT